MRSMISILLLVLISVAAVGCADIEVPRPDKIMRNPIGFDAAKRGMPKGEVQQIYGEADIVTHAVVSEGWEGVREEWFYRARVSALPVNAGYLAEDLYLYFDGNSLTKISRSPMGRPDIDENVK